MRPQCRPACSAFTCRSSPRPSRSARPTAPRKGTRPTPNVLHRTDTKRVVGGVEVRWEVTSNFGTSLGYWIQSQATTQAAARKLDKLTPRRWPGAVVFQLEAPPSSIMRKTSAGIPCPLRATGARRLLFELFMCTPYIVVLAWSPSRNIG